MALAYKDKLENLEPKVKFLMTLYLSPELTIEEGKKAKEAGIVGVKSYPKYSPYYFLQNLTL
jgi:dihydroorotase